MENAIVAKPGSVANPHHRYLEMVYTWEKLRDAVGGARLIKRRLPDMREYPVPSTNTLRVKRQGGERYLPRLYRQDDEEYITYRNRATWLEATARTLSFYISLIFRKPVKIEMGGQVMRPKWAVGPAGESLHTLCENIARDFFITGRVGLLPDTTDDGQVRTVAQREAGGFTSFLSWYRAEQIINWRHAPRAGQLELVVLREALDLPGTVAAGSEFDHHAEVQYRVLRLRPEGATVEVVRENQEVVEAERPIMVGGQQVQEIPFRIVDVNDSLTSPIDGIVELNIAHYRNSASYENALHHAGSPTPTLAGWDGDGEDLFLGTGRALVSRNKDFRASYLELNGHGLNPLQEALNDKRRDMANLGARLLMDQARFNEAAETVLMRKAGEQSTIGQLAQMLDIQLSWAMSWMARYEGMNDDVRVRLNRDLLPASISHQMVVALMNLQISGNLSKRALFERLRDGEIVDPEADFDSMMEEVKEDQKEEAERLMLMGESELIGRHADRSMPGDPNDRHGHGAAPAR